MPRDLSEIIQVGLFAAQETLLMLKTAVMLNTGTSKKKIRIW